jgi:hypothetical protein
VFNRRNWHYSKEFSRHSPMVTGLEAKEQAFNMGFCCWGVVEGILIFLWQDNNVVIDKYPFL